MCWDDRRIGKKECISWHDITGTYEMYSINRSVPYPRRKTTKRTTSVQKPDDQEAKGSFLSKNF